MQLIIKARHLRLCNLGPWDVRKRQSPGSKQRLLPCCTWQQQTLTFGDIVTSTVLPVASTQQVLPRRPIHCCSISAAFSLSQLAKMKGEFCYYFAYGSMCNPISLSKRGIQAVPPSLPATISGYDLQFSYGGMANLVADASSTVHGILHKVPMEQFKILCDIESGYDTVSVPATPYEPRTCSSKDPSNHDCQCGSSSVKNYDTSFTAQAFIIHPQRMAELKHLHPDEGNFLPSERYLLIITQGLQHFGADPGWIRRISSNPFKPTKTRDQCLTAESASDPAQLPTWTQQQLAAYEGKVDDQKVTMACGLKVLEVDFSSNNAAPFIPTLRDRMSGRDFTFGICQALYDPRLPPLNSPEDVTEAHIVYAEDLTVEWVRLQGMTIRQVGWLETQDKQQDDMQTSQAGN